VRKKSGNEGRMSIDKLYENLYFRWKYEHNGCDKESDGDVMGQEYTKSKKQT
jgi:hypothetical protein